MADENIKSLRVETTQGNQMINITGKVQDVVRASGVEEGSCLLFVPHTTAGVTINENADPDVTSDILSFLNEKIPRRYPSFRHGEGNSDAHLKSTIVGTSLEVIISGGNLLLGTWQGIFFCEFDGPRNRVVWLKVRKDY